MMKKIAFLVGIFFGGFVFANGQANPAQPTPNPAQEVKDMVRRNEQINRRFDSMRNGGNRTFAQGEMRDIFFQRIIPLYRKPTKAELKLLAPNAEDVKKYAAFLKPSNTGITKLAADFGCAENPSVVVATPDCLIYTMPGAGSSFSFRVKNYRIRRLADLTFAKNSFLTTGVLVHGILVNLGDVSLEQVSLETRGVKYLLDFAPAVEFQKAAETERELVAGIEKDGFSYRNGLAAEANATYFLRSIAYRGFSMRAVSGIAYNELDFDRREDIFIAFRIIRQDADGSLTILWKELDSKKSPRLKREKRERNNVRESNFTANNW